MGPVLKVTRERNDRFLTPYLSSSWSAKNFLVGFIAPRVHCCVTRGTIRLHFLTIDVDQLHHTR